MSYLTLKIKFILLMIGLLSWVCIPVESGTIKGKITSKKTIPRKVAKRYPGKHSQQPHEMESIPAVILILGKVKGFPSSSLEKENPAEIKQKDFMFQPSLLIVPVNTTVIFPNEDLEFHNVFSYSKIKRFDLGRYHKGESKSVLFDKPGIGQIYCEVHEWMRAVIVVVENPFYAIAGTEGNYLIEGIPKGSYQLLVWKIDHKKIIRNITVPEKGVLELNFSLPEKKQNKDE